MKYMSLDQRGRIQAEYVWIDAVGGTRSKTKVRTIVDFDACHVVVGTVGGAYLRSISPAQGTSRTRLLQPSASREEGQWSHDLISDSR